MYFIHPIYVRTGTTEKQTQDLLDVPSKNLIGREHLIFNRTILNILSNVIPHEIIVCNDKDLPWFNNRIKTLIQKKKKKKKRHIGVFAITKIILILYIV